MENIKQKWNYYNLGSQWIIANGQRINFWHDHWLSNNTSLRSLLIGPLRPSEFQTTMSNYTSHAQWNLECIPFVLSPSLFHWILSIYFPFSITSPDTLIWGLINSGTFTVKSCYSTVVPQNNYSPYNWLRKLHLPPKLLYILWLCSYQRLPTNAYLAHLNIINTNLCHHCSTQAETLSHLFFDCPTPAHYGKS